MSISDPIVWFKNLPVRLQLIIGLSFLGILHIAITGTVIIAFKISEIEEEVKELSRRETELVATLSNEPFIAEDRTALKTIVDNLKRTDGGLVLIEWTNREADSLALWIDHSNQERIVSSSKSIVYNGNEIGTLFMAWKYSYFAKSILGSQVWLLFSTLVALAFLILILDQGLNWYLVQPLEYLERKVRAVAEQLPLPDQGNIIVVRELRRLDESLDRAAKVLKEKVEAEFKIISETSRAENAEISAKAKMKFLSLMSHEIRTPLGAIIGFGRLLETANLNKEETSILENLNASGRFLLTIINDILDLSKFEANGIELEIRPVQLGPMIDELQRMVQPLAVAKGISLDFRCVGLNGKQIYADLHRLKQVLMNLVGNAVKFTDSGCVSVRVHAIEFSNDALCGEIVRIGFKVCDTGIGMSEDQSKRIFDPFTQADSKISRKYGGTGLGLSIASQLVSKMGGEIKVESVIGVGSTFSFEASFAMFDGANAKRTPRSPKKQEFKYVADSNLRILIAEDEKVNRILIDMIFSSMGHKGVEIVEDGQACFDRLQQGIDFDVIFLDLHMPHIGGFEIARMLRSGKFGAAGVDVKLVIMSADVLAVDEGYLIGVDEYIFKPVDPILLQSFLHSNFSASNPPNRKRIRENLVDHAVIIRRALVVDDQESYRNLMAQILKKAGFDVCLAKDGNDCLEFLAGGPELDAIFLDLRMPGMDGRTVARKIRDGSAGASYVKTPIAVVSAEMMSDNDVDALGVDGFFSKPVDFERIQEFARGVELQVAGHL